MKALGRILLLLIVCASVQSNDVDLPAILQQLDVHNILQVISKSDSKTNCTQAVNLYLSSLKTEEWAQLMFDSTAKIPEGILMGNSKFLGQFDECIGVEDTSIDFVGQHCMLDLIFTQKAETAKTFKRKSPFETFASPMGLLPMSFAFGICVPSSCSALEVESGLNEVLNGSVLSVKVDPLNCYTKEPRPMSTGEWVVIGFLIVMGVIAVCSTSYDVFQREFKKNENPHPLLSSFSVYTNGKRLFATNSGEGQLNCLHGLRTLSMTWVVLCHAYMYAIFGPAVNMGSIADMFTNLNHISITNGFVAVDSFFFLSGLLVCFVFFRDIGKSGTYDVPLGYIHRYLRLTPPFAAMVLMQATILTYFGNGPMWHATVDSSKDMCVENWWSGLLYIQNFVAANSNCLGQSWYLSADMQMYWVSPLVLFPLLLWPVFAPAYLGLLILTAAFANFAIAYVNKLGPALAITTSLHQNDYDYTQFYTRLAPWLIGAATAYLLCGIRAKKITIKLRPWQILCGWLLSTGLCLGSLYGLSAFLDPEMKYDYTPFQASFYLAFHRVGWALGLAWIVFACVQGYGGIINTFLSWEIFQPLGKLSYCAFLIHRAVQDQRMGRIRTNFYLGDLEVVYFFLGDWVITNLISIPFTLLFEMPFFSIERYLFRNVKILPLPLNPKTRPVKREIKTDEEAGKNVPSSENKP